MNDTAGLFFVMCLGLLAAAITVSVFGVFALLAYIRSMRPILMVSIEGRKLKITNAGKSGIYNLQIETMMPPVESGTPAFEVTGPRLAMKAGQIGVGRSIELVVKDDIAKKIEDAEDRVQVYGERSYGGSPFRMTVAALRTPSFETSRMD